MILAAKDLTSYDSEVKMEMKIRNLSFNEFQILSEWAVAENWNIGASDPEIFHAVDPEGYFGAFKDKQLIGAISAVAYDAAFGFIGFFIVKPEFRGHAVGIELGRKAMEYLGTRIIGVDGVENKVHNYEHFGFKLAHHNIRYEGIVDDAECRDGLVEATELPFDKLIAFDRQFFPANRKSFLSMWINQPECFSLAAYTGGKIQGYGVIRKCRNGYKIGPLFALNQGTARKLFVNLTAKLRLGETFFMDIPATNTKALALADEHLMRPVFKTARMYANGIPNVQMENIYGVTSFELG
jgi:ribosomal protein S18 acetylase RimI-like enzyme